MSSKSGHSINGRFQDNDLFPGLVNFSLKSRNMKYFTIISVILFVQKISSQDQR